MKKTKKSGKFLMEIIRAEIEVEKVGSLGVRG